MLFHAAQSWGAACYLGAGGAGVAGCGAPGGIQANHVGRADDLRPFALAILGQRFVGVGFVARRRLGLLVGRRRALGPELERADLPVFFTGAAKPPCVGIEQEVSQLRRAATFYPGRKSSQQRVELFAGEA